MEPETFEQFKNLVYQQSGITLGPGKITLVGARIARRRTRRSPLSASKVFRCAQAMPRARCPPGRNWQASLRPCLASGRRL